MVVCGARKVMAGCGWSRVVGVKLWLVLGDGDKIMTGCKIMADSKWSWVVMDGRVWTDDLVVLTINQIISFFAHFLEYSKLVLDDNMDEGSE